MLRLRNPLDVNHHQHAKITLNGKQERLEQEITSIVWR